RFLLPATGSTGREAGRDHARQISQAGLFRKLRHRGGGGGAEAGALPHAAAPVHRLSGLFSWPDVGRAVSDSQQGGTAAGFWTAAGGRPARGLPQPVSLPAWSRRSALFPPLRLHAVPLKIVPV